MYRKIIYLSVLFSFSFLLIPKEYWHHCEEHEQVINKQEKTYHEADNDCDICDFKLFQLNQIEPKTTIYLTIYLKTNERLHNQHLNSFNQQFLNKGPPSNS
jgi:hypothetical protein